MHTRTAPIILVALTGRGTPSDAGPAADVDARGGDAALGADAGPPFAPGGEAGEGGTVEVGAARVAITPTVGNPNPPDLDTAPPPPYLRDLARPDADQGWLLGMTNDDLGHLVPAYFQRQPRTPWLDGAERDH